MHEGHRQRLKKRFRLDGLDKFEDHTALELLLFYALPQHDTNPLAHALMDHFGKLAAVFDAPMEDLMKVKGVGENTALLIKLIPQMSRKYLVSKADNVICLNTTCKAGKYLLPRFYAHRNEVVYIVCLDAKCKVLGCIQLFEGNVNSANVSIRKIIETALSFNATSVILAHNHTSGIALPSADDEKTTILIKNALESVSIRLSDHIIIADDDFVSMADNGILR